MNISSPRVKLAIKAVFEEGVPPKGKEPLTFAHLKLLWPVMCDAKEFTLFSALLSLGFFSGMRASEYTFDSSVPGSEPARVGQLSFDSHIRSVTFSVARSKTKPHGFSVTLGCSGHSICAYCSLQAYLQLRACGGYPSSNTALFLFASGKPVSKLHVTNYIKSLVASLGWKPENFASHSLRVGLASTAGSLGFENWQIKKLGRWNSEAFNRYVRPSLNYDKNLASKLAQCDYLG